MELLTKTFRTKKQLGNSEILFERMGFLERGRETYFLWGGIPLKNFLYPHLKVKKQFGEKDF